MSTSDKVLLYLATLSLKLLLLPAPHSTDLDVHRHWKSLTYHKPLSSWYVDASSVWTLDYPPLFACFEYALSCLVAPFYPRLADPTIERHTAVDVTVLRLTVLLCEPLLHCAVYKLANALHPYNALRNSAIAILLPGLTLVDNIHFQYNALPLSFLLLSLSSTNIHVSTVLFCLTLNLKQTFLPLAPVFFLNAVTAIHRAKQPLSKKLLTIITLTLAAALSLALPWTPFFLTNTYKSVIVRIFPLHRGLLHANWAPNIWAPYATLDRILSRLTIKNTSPITRGIINVAHPFTTLPNPTPLICLALIILSMAPFMLTLYQQHSLQTFVTAVSAAALSSFLFGWHVHEKAVLIPLLILSLTKHHQPFVWLSLGGQFALLELLRSPAIAPFLIAHFIAFHAALFAIYPIPRGALLYFVGCLTVEAYAGVLGGHRLLFGPRMEFLPIMLVSLYSFVGVSVAYVKLLQSARERPKTD